MENFDIYKQRAENLACNVIMQYLTMICGWGTFGIALSGVKHVIIAGCISGAFIAASLYFTFNIMTESVKVISEIKELKDLKENKNK